MSKSIALVQDYRNYVTQQAGSRITSNVLREAIVACRNVLPRVFQIIINAENGRGGRPMLASYFFVDGKRLELTENNIPSFERADAVAGPTPSRPMLPPADLRQLTLQQAQTATAPSNFEVTDIDCGGTFYAWMRVPHGAGWTIRIRIPEHQQLAQQDIRIATFDAAFSQLKQKCEVQNRPGSVAVVAIATPGFEGSVLTAWLHAGERKWNVTIDNVDKATAIINAQIAADNARKQADAERAAAIKAKKDQEAAAEASVIDAQYTRATELEKQAEDSAAARAKARPADSYCLWSCDPLEVHGRISLKHQLESTIKTKVILFNFVKTNGVKSKALNVDLYEMYFTADLELPLGFVARPKDFYDEVSKSTAGMNAFVELTQAFSVTRKMVGEKWWDSKSYSISGVVRFRKTEKGWMDAYGRIY